MRVALLVGVLLLDAVAGLYQVGWMDLAPSSGDQATGQVQAMDDWPPPPPPPSWP